MGKEVKRSFQSQSVGGSWDLNQGPLDTNMCTVSTEVRKECLLAYPLPLSQILSFQSVPPNSSPVHGFLEDPEAEVS